MEIYILDKGRAIGPYTEMEVFSRIRDGLIDETTPAALSPDATWKSLGEVMSDGMSQSYTPEPVPPSYTTYPVPPVPLPPPPQETVEQVYEQEWTKPRSKRPKISTDLAACSLVFGIFGIIPLLAIPAVICGHLALLKISKKPGEYGGRGMALWGVWLGWIVIFITITKLFVVALG